MVSLFRRLLRLLGFKPRSSHRSRPRVDARYAYERDEKGRLLRRSARGVERLDYESWHPVERPESKQTSNKRNRLQDLPALGVEPERGAAPPVSPERTPDYGPPSVLPQGPADLGAGQEDPQAGQASAPEPTA
jgi:hypothetical protein